MSKSITQDMVYRQSLMKYAEKYGVSRASRKYNKSRSDIYFWKQRWDGSVASLACQSRRPHSHPNQHTEAELKIIRDMRRRNPTLGMIELWHRLRGRGYTRCPESLFRMMRRLGMFPNPKPKKAYNVKIISGDSPAAAAAVARLSGVRSADRLLDATGLTDEELARAAANHTVFGRVTPEQKKVLISALQKQGHKVAMTGDGGNDLLAMRQADCSAAMGNGSDAAKQMAQLVLLDSDFAVLREVISEGRRVINNLTKSAGVFFIKTIYSVLLSVLCLLMNTDFPFIPIQITLIDTVIEAFPAFFMSFERNDRKVEGAFLSSAVRSALPNSIAIFLGCIAVFLAAPRLGLNHAQMNLVMYLTVGVVSLAGVVKASLPMNLLRGFLSIVSVLGFFCASLLFAPLLQLPHLAVSGATLLLPVAIPCTLIAMLLKVRVPESSLLIVGK